jgi:hypothetical protein
MNHSSSAEDGIRNFSRVIHHTNTMGDGTKVSLLAYTLQVLFVNLIKIVRTRPASIHYMVSNNENTGKGKGKTKWKYHRCTLKFYSSWWCKIILRPDRLQPIEDNASSIHPDTITFLELLVRNLIRLSWVGRVPLLD